ncbi:MAG: phosphatase PAP2 family protein [Stackebrandtia sp.]
MPPRLDSSCVASEEPSTPREEPGTAERPPRWEPFGKTPTSWWPDALLALGVAVNTLVLMWSSPAVDLDVWVRKLAYYLKIEWVREVALAVTYLGSGRVGAPIVLALALWLALRHKSIRPLLLYIFCFLPLPVILATKHLTGRPSPRHPFQLIEAFPDGPVLFTHLDEAAGYMGKAMAYPSGHAANAVVWYGLAVILVGSLMGPRTRMLTLILPPALVTITQTYVGWHWLLDLPAGFMLGMLVIRAAKRVPWARMPLGPLECFEPASPKTILGFILLIVGLLLCQVLPGGYAFLFGIIIILCGLTWWFAIHPGSPRTSDRDVHDEA